MINLNVYLIYMIDLFIRLMCCIAPNDNKLVNNPTLELNEVQSVNCLSSFLTHVTDLHYLILLLDY